MIRWIDMPNQHRTAKAVPRRLRDRENESPGDRTSTASTDRMRAGEITMSSTRAHPPAAATRRRSLPISVAHGALTVLVILFACLSLGRAFDHISYLIRVTAPSRTLDVWAVLDLADIAISLAAAFAAWRSLQRRAYAWVVVFLLLQLVAPVVIEANRCDVERVCRNLSWALLPRALTTWTLRLPG
ncbi:MAG TPA: hypothetical protein VGL66_06385 [Caulobacteraceae bacterium]